MLFTCLTFESRLIFFVFTYTYKHYKKWFYSKDGSIWTTEYKVTASISKNKGKYIFNLLLNESGYKISKEFEMKMYTKTFLCFQTF